MELRSILGSFLFTGDAVFKKIKVLSGGEKSRVALAKTLISEANFLLLDEPTNHLDMQSVNILIQALEQYEGTFVVISHDRYFVENVANKIWYIEDYQLKEYPGTYHEYEYWQEQREKGGKKSGTAVSKMVETKPEPTKATPSNSSGNQANLQQELKKLNQQLKDVETQISSLEAKQTNLESQLADPEIYGNPNQLQEVTQQFEAIKKQLDEKNSHWEETLQAIDELESQAKKIKG
jgi:ATP-binding cassette subfamily F protein 3